MNHSDVLKLLFPLKDVGGVFSQDIGIEGSYLDALKTSAENLLLELFPDTCTSATIADWERIYGIIPPANTRQAYLSRASVAYLSDGTQVASGAPRYEVGKYGKAIMAEEQTTNLVSTLDASFETGITGWAAGLSVTHSQSNARASHGSYSLKTITDGTQAYAQEISPIYAVTELIPYTAQCKVYGVASSKMSLDIYDVTHAAYLSTGVAYTTELNSWKLLTVTVTPPAGCTQIKIYLRPNFGFAEAAEVYWDSIQLEQKAYATSWQLPGSARAVEPLSLFTAGLFSPIAGSWAQWVDITDVTKRQVSGQYNMVLYIPGTDPDARIELFHQPTTANWHIQSKDDTGAATGASVADSYTPNGKHRFLLTWDATALKLYLDGVLRATVLNPKLPSAFASSAYIGSNGTTYFLNAVHDDVQTWDRVLSEIEAAADYARGSAGVPAAGTTALFPFDEDLFSIDLVARRAAIVQQKRLRRKLTRSYFVAIAAAVGYTITIEEMPPNAAEYGGSWSTIYIWKVHVPIGAKVITDFTAGDSGAGDLLADWQEENTLETLFNALKPAHTHVYFVYE